MEIKIIETNEIKNLDIIDPKTGINWISDLMGNHDALPEREEIDEMETGYYLMSDEDHDWWARLVERYQAADDRYNELLDLLDDDEREELERDAQGINVDLEDHPRALSQVCDKYDK